MMNDFETKLEATIQNITALCTHAHEYITTLFYMIYFSIQFKLPSRIF